MSLKLMVPPINYRYTGTTYHLSGKLGGKYPNGVPFNRFGLPDFSRYSVKHTGSVAQHQSRKRKRKGKC